MKPGNYILMADRNDPREIARFSITTDGHIVLTEARSPLVHDLLPPDGPLDRNGIRELILLDHHFHYFIKPA
jgi:hypothetical protein